MTGGPTHCPNIGSVPTWPWAAASAVGPRLSPHWREGCLQQCECWDPGWGWTDKAPGSPSPLFGDVTAGHGAGNAALGTAAIRLPAVAWESIGG